jgi:diguanylate cyclase (GGDEF)-like protein
MVAFVLAVLAGALGWLAATRAAAGRERRAERDAARLLEAAVALTHATGETQAAAAVAATTRDLLDADLTVLLLADASGSTRFVAQGGARAVTRVGWPAEVLAPIDDVFTDPTGVGLAARTGRVVHAGEATAADLWPTGIDGRTPAGSAAFVPVHGDAGVLGVIVVAWAARQRGIDAFGERALALLVPQAGRVLERLRATQRLAVAAETDPLTGLANRRGFERLLGDVRPGDALVVCDLDHFKAVNDTYGHAAGDDLLADFGAVVRSVIRRHDAAGRLGGEEFVILIAEAGTEDRARAVVERLRAEWRASRPLTTFSAGLAVADRRNDPLAVLDRADRAMYAAKRAGRDRVVAEREVGGVPVLV